MYKQSDFAYMYDGSFEGFMCCVFECVYNKEMPQAILSEMSEQGLLYPIKYIETDAQRANRVITSVPVKMNRQALYTLRMAFLTCLPEKEMNMLGYMLLGYKIGSKITSSLTTEPVWTIERAVKCMRHEAHLFTGFIRFSDFGGVLVTEIEPKNYILPIIAPHFSDRFNAERYLIYDKAHGMAAVGQDGKWQIVPMESFTMPVASGSEKSYRQLWRDFYNTIAIEGRYNPKCRMSHMPKRYWAYMTEFQSDEPSAAAIDDSSGTAIGVGTGEPSAVLKNNLKSFEKSVDICR